MYYADSVTSPAIQAADLIAGIRRRVVEGDANLRSLGRDLAALRPDELGSERTHTGRRWTNQITLF